MPILLGENTNTMLSGAGSVSLERFDAFRLQMVDVFDMNTMYQLGTYEERERERVDSKYYQLIASFLLTACFFVKRKTPNDWC